MTTPLSLKQLLRTTDKFVNILASEHITTADDLLRYFPRTYEDRRHLSTVATLTFDETLQTVKLQVIKKSLIRTPTGKKLSEIHLQDEAWATCKISGINTTYLLRQLETKKRYYIIGKPQYTSGKVVFWHPEIVPAADEAIVERSIGKIFPIYPSLQWISASRFAKKILTILPALLDNVQETLPERLRQKYDLVDVRTMMRALHCPDDRAMLDKAKERMFFERLLRIQISSQLAKRDYQQVHDVGTPDWELLSTFLKTLPYTLTHAQKKVLKEIVEDMYTGRSMLRLLQGDVGSGKTVVATAVARYMIKKHTAQAVFLAPIEVLAQQHFQTLAKLLLPLGIRMQLLTGTTPPAEKTRIKNALAQGNIDIVVGTHALLQEWINFHNLQFVIIDEQHKFGVKQRSFFQQFGSPHILQMTATPIPRSLALVYFGEFAVSVIDEMPVGRKPITTKIINQNEFVKLKPRVLNKIAQGQQLFIITPLIEESDKLDDVSNAQQVHQDVIGLYPELAGKIWLLHGRIKADEKNKTMQDFKDGKLVILVSTTVIEVGIDVPQATMMIIQNAERFGLAQLHQLRWRVGRSDLQSYCFLQTKHKSGDAYARLRHLEQQHSGHVLAQLDLEARGSGELLGIRQSGITDLPLSIINDTAFVEKTQHAALDLLEHHPDMIAQFISNDLQESLDGMLV
jgi:ATP-dependent DNA helicase RecG